MLPWSAHVVTVPPAGPVFTADDVRDHVRADSTDDTLLEAYVEAATAHVEAFTGTKLLTQTVRLTRPDLDPRPMPLLVGPVQSLSLTYLDSAGTVQTLDSSLYAVTGFGTRRTSIALLSGAGKVWPALLDHPAAVVATAVVGYGADGGAVPAAIRQAIRLLVGDFYMNREDTIAERSVTPAALPNGVQALLANYRVW